VDDEPRDQGTPNARTPAGRDSGRRAALARFEALGTFGTLGSVGLSFVIALVIGTAVGWWLDNVTGWSPLFFILFFFLGLAAGIRNVYITTKKFMK